MKVTNRLKNQHLLWRAAFGPMAEMSESLDTLDDRKLWKMLKQSSAGVPEKLTPVSRTLSDMYENRSMAGGEMSAADRAQLGVNLRRQSREDLAAMNIEWLSMMVNSKAQLREKMSLFWHGHFATRQPNSYFQQGLLSVIRTHALGNFRTLLTEVSKSAAMLSFLNNQQNRKRHPNENFAREVMELFALGRGNYTEQDIKEGARAFTGWAHDGSGNFTFKKNQHDDGSKTFLGQTGNFDGDDALKIILEKPAAATFIVRKIYRYFVNENVDESRVKALADSFRKDYEILPLLENIYTSDWFYDEKNIGVRIKSPIELLAGIRRFMPITFDAAQSQLTIQKLLGQVLFYPPNVAGWPGGKNYIDSSSLMLRLQLPQIMTARENITLRPKSDDDVNMGMKAEAALQVKKNAGGGNASGSIDWSTVVKAFSNVKREQLATAVTDALLQTESRVPLPAIDKYISQSSREEFIKTSLISTMSTPEYQLC